MNRKFLSAGMVILVSVCFAGCSKGRKNDMFTLKYEVITTSDVAAPFPSINTQAGLEKQTHVNFTSGRKWEFSRSLESSYRPFQVVLNGQNIRLISPGKATLNIYVNNSLKGTSTRESVIIGSENVVTTGPVGYTIN